MCDFSIFVQSGSPHDVPRSFFERRTRGSVRFVPILEGKQAVNWVLQKWGLPPVYSCTPGEGADRILDSTAGQDQKFVWKAKPDAINMPQD